MPKTVICQTIQFSISTQFSSIQLIDKTLSVDTTAGQSGPGNDGNIRVHWISRTLVGGVLPLCSDAVGEYCTPTDWAGVGV